MLTLRTSDDWTAATLTVDEGGPSQAFTFAAADNSGLDGALAFAVWYDANFAPNTVTATYARTGSDGTITTTFSFDVNVTVTANAAAQTLTGLPASTGPADTMSSAWAGTWAPLSGHRMGRWLRRLGRGMGSGVGSVRPGLPGTSLRQPTVEAVGDAEDASRIASVLGSAATPCEAWIYQEHTATWRLVSVGEVSRERIDGARWRWSIEAVG